MSTPRMAMHLVMALQMVLHSGMDCRRAMRSAAVANTTMDHCRVHLEAGLGRAVPFHVVVLHCMGHRGEVHCCT